MALAYGAIFLSAGAVLPYLSVWFQSRGLDGRTIGLTIGLAMLARFGIVMLGGVLADRFRAPRRVMQGFGAVSIIMFGVLWFMHAPAWIILAAVCAVGASAPLVPLLEAAALRSSRRDGFSYGLVRAIGSMTFVLANLVVGALMSPKQFGPDILIAWSMCAIALYVVAVRIMPRPPVPIDTGPDLPSRDWSVLWRRDFALALGASACIQASHAFYYAFSALVWLGEGLSEFTVGALWGWGVIAEVFILAVYAKRIERWGAPVLLLMGALVAAVRWAALGFDPDQAWWSGLAVIDDTLTPIIGPTGFDAFGPAPPSIIWLVVIQVLHAGSFALSHLGVMVFIVDHLPDNVSGTAQSLNSGLSMGMGLAVATTVSGILYAAVGGVGYLPMAGLALLGAGMAMWLWVSTRPTPTALAKADA